MSIRSDGQFEDFSVGAFVGNTPLIELKGIAGPGAARVLAKAEFMNPGGSVKDRICRSMLLDAHARGLLPPDAVVIESTSGNTGIGLAMLCASLGYQCLLTMPESMSPERIKLLKGYGARVELSSVDGGMAEAILLGESFVNEFGDRAYSPSQFENPANPRAHELHTAPEILAQVSADQIAAFVAAVGTGGTVSGTGRVLKQANSATQVVAVEPEASPVISGGKPGAHRIQGIGAGFIPDTLDLKVLDEVMTVTEQEAFDWRHRLGREYGILAGISSGANVASAIKVARRFDPSSCVITVLCDTGERYLSIET